jgi:hypothetical protein
MKLWAHAVWREKSLMFKKMLVLSPLGGSTLLAARSRECVDRVIMGFVMLYLELAGIVDV